ncbi:MAG: glycosyltransferase family 2 protein [Minisyncoccales bacterium]|jgi:cellulose synthase/poly-beta-1,6-N-acetylglucosamine synthase-like glycosyltransferase
MKEEYLKVSRYSDLEDPKERFIYRALEIFPGALSWSIIILSIIAAYFFPLFTAGFIIAFAVFWFLRSIYFSFHLRAGYKIMRENEARDWINELESLPKGELVDHWSDIYHLIVIPTYDESEYILKNTINSINENDYPKDKMIVVLAMEERAGEQGVLIGKKMEELFCDKFFKFLVVSHPKDIPGEIAGKSSNEAWATRVVKESVIDKLKIPYKKIILTSLDSDTVVYPKYFSCLTHYYLTADNPIRSSFQPIPLYINNIWEASPISRVFAFSSTFWHTINQQRPEKLITFSSHSMSFQSLVDIGFKQTNVVSEDSRVFWQCLLKFNGDYEVIPIHYPVSMDANTAPTFIKTAINTYKQKRRWAYGVENIPYFLFGFMKNKKLPFSQKWRFGFEVIEGQLTWATAPILIYILGWLPIIFARGDFANMVASYNLPIILSRILTLAMFGLVGSAYLSILLLPPKPPNYGKATFVILILQWVIVPFTMIFFSAFPALEAQTRLMLGKYMGFWPTPKYRKDDQ